MNKTTKYRQIDFLRLFKICKDAGIVKRKRKMPTEYKENNERSAGKRLLHDLIKHLFPNYDIRTDSAQFYISIPRDIYLALSGLSNKPRSYYDNAGTEGADALQKYTALRQNFGGHIYPRFPYEIIISIYNGDNNSKYNQLTRNGIMTSRPREDYYSCATKCIEYQKLWNESAPSLAEFFRVEEGRQKEREAEALKLKQERRRAERLHLEQESAGQKIEKPEELKKVEEKITKEKQSKNQVAQDAFNRAMQQFTRG